MSGTKKGIKEYIYDNGTTQRYFKCDVESHTAVDSIY